MSGHALAMLIRLGSNLVMTRLLVPEMFGVMAIAAIVASMITMLSDIGVRQNIVQSRRGNVPVFLDTAWVVQIVRGLILWLIALLASIGLYFANAADLFNATSVYAKQELPIVIAISSLSVVIQGFQSTKIATAFRNLDQKRLVQRELIGQVAGLIVMLVIAVITQSIWALVAGGLVSSLTTSVLSHVLLPGHANRFRWEKQSLRELADFGKWVFISSGVSVLAAKGDRLILGAFVNAEVLGFYSIAVLLVGAISDGLHKFFSGISLPAFSEVVRNNPSRLREIYYKMRLPSDLLLLFFSGALFAAGSSVIDLLYDHRYSSAGKMLEVLALSLFFTRYGVVYQIYLALGMPRYLTIINVLRFVSLYTVSPVVYYFFGADALIWAIALHSLVIVPFIYGFNSRLGLNDIRRELLVLLALPIGYLSGYGFNQILG